MATEAKWFSNEKWGGLPLLQKESEISLKKRGACRGAYYDLAMKKPTLEFRLKFSVIVRIKKIDFQRVEDWSNSFNTVHHEVIYWKEKKKKKKQPQIPTTAWFSTYDNREDAISFTYLCFLTLSSPRLQIQPLLWFIS